MRKTDLFTATIGVGLTLFFALEGSRTFYEMVYLARPLAVTFVKFALLATGGEILAMRIREGRYRLSGFGTLPKMAVWGFLGLAIYAAFGIFSAGVPLLFAPLLDRWSNSAVPRALLISIFLNIFFAPVMMVTHHLTDRHIAAHGGQFSLTGFHPAALLGGADWSRLWSIVFARTIPLFWIPAHTVTFLLPPQFRTLFAAALSIVLGLFMGTVARKGAAPEGGR